MISSAGKKNIESLAVQMAEAQAEMMLSVGRGGKDATRAKEVLAYTIEQMAFAIILEIKG